MTVTVTETTLLLALGTAVGDGRAVAMARDLSLVPPIVPVPLVPIWVLP